MLNFKFLALTYSNEQIFYCTFDDAQIENGDGCGGGIYDLRTNGSSLSRPKLFQFPDTSNITILTDFTSLSI